MIRAAPDRVAIERSRLTCSTSRCPFGHRARANEAVQQIAADNRDAFRRRPCERSCAWLDESAHYRYASAAVAYAHAVVRHSSRMDRVRARDEAHGRSST